MASAVPYEPEGFGAESNPFAQENVLAEPSVLSEPATETLDEPAESPIKSPTKSPVPATVATPPVKPIKRYKLVLKISGLERQGKKDPIFRFDAYVRLL